MRSIFVVGQHGNEKLPVRATSGLNNQIEVLVANPGAVEMGVRFLETDLNRSFPGNINGKHEERLAVEIKNKLASYGEVVDFHTATCGTPLFAIVTKMTNKHLELVRKLGVGKVVYMENSIASGKSLIDHVDVGVSIEAGREKTKSVLLRIKKVMNHYLVNKKISKNKLEIFVVFKIIKKDKEMKRLPRGTRNFKKMIFEGEVVFPVLARETSYPEVLCLLARKVSLDSIILGKEENYE